ncbi:MAG: hypothetical protein ACYS9X_30600, partial [Planctomycetota bacterium]
MGSRTRRFGIGYRRDLVFRWEGNPAVAIDDLPFPCNDVRNAGVVKVGDTYVLLITISSLEGQTHIYRARSNDGYHFEVDAKPVLKPSGKEPFA